MTPERRINVQRYLKSLKAAEHNPDFLAFLNSLSIEEKEAYFYIDAQRIDCFIKELSFGKGNSVGIIDLKNKESLKNLPNGIIKSKQAVNSLIEFWEAFALLPKPNRSLRRSIIEKHNKHIRELSEEEIKFFLEC